MPNKAVSVGRAKNRCSAEQPRWHTKGDNVKIIKFSVIPGLLSVLLLGCNQEAMIDKFTPKAEVEYSKKYLALFQSHEKSSGLFASLIVLLLIVWV